MNLQNLANLHKNIASDVPVMSNGQLRCSECGHIIELNSDMSAQYLAQGWPKCHGYTMILESKSNPTL